MSKIFFSLFWFFLLVSRFFDKCLHAVFLRNRYDVRLRFHSMVKCFSTSLSVRETNVVWHFSGLYENRTGEVRRKAFRHGSHLSLQTTVALRLNYVLFSAHVYSKRDQCKTVKTKRVIYIFRTMFGKFPHLIWYVRQ